MLLLLAFLFPLDANFSTPQSLPGKLNTPFMFPQDEAQQVPEYSPGNKHVIVEDRISRFFCSNYQLQPSHKLIK